MSAISFQFVGADLHRLIVNRATIEPQKLTLAAERKWTVPLHHRQPSHAFYSPDLRNKKSRSTMSRPDLLVQLGHRALGQPNDPDRDAVLRYLDGLHRGAPEDHRDLD